MEENSFDGIWMHVKGKDVYGKNTCLMFNGYKGIYFDIETEKDDVLHLVETEIEEDISKGNFEFVTDGRLKIFKKGIQSAVYSDKIVSEEMDIEYVFIRLAPTKASLAKEDIPNFEFDVKWNKERFKVIFDKVLDSEIVQAMNARLGRGGRKILLEQFKETLFLSIFDNDEREKLIPIKEIDQERIVLTGFPSEPFEAVGTRSN